MMFKIVYEMPLTGGLFNTEHRFHRAEAIDILTRIRAVDSKARCWIAPARVRLSDLNYIRWCLRLNRVEPNGR